MNMTRLIFLTLLFLGNAKLPQVQHPFQVEGGKNSRRQPSTAELLVKNRATVESHDLYYAVVRKDCPVRAPCICHCACPGVILVTTLPPNWVAGGPVAALTQTDTNKSHQAPAPPGPYVPLSAPPYFAAPPVTNLIPPPPAPAPAAAPKNWPGDQPCPGPACDCFCHCNYV